MGVIGEGVVLTKEIGVTPLVRIIGKAMEIGKVLVFSRMHGRIPPRPFTSLPSRT